MSEIIKDDDKNNDVELQTIKEKEEPIPEDTGDGKEDNMEETKEEEDYDESDEDDDESDEYKSEESDE